MAKVEKYIAKRINKDTHPSAIARDGNRMLLPGDMTDALNCVFDRDGVVRSPKGNILRDFDLGSGTHKVISAYPYEKINTIIYGVWSSEGNHKIIEWDPLTNAFTILVSGVALAFEEDLYITQIGIVDNIYVWSDTKNPIGKFNIDRARTGFYINLAVRDKIHFVAIPPTNPPTHQRIYDAEILINRIRNKNLQFCYRFIYLDNETSEESPISDISRGYIFPNSPKEIMGIDLSDFNTVEVTISIPSNLIGLLLGVEVLYRDGNSGTFYVFETIKNPSLDSYTIKYTGYGTVVSPISIQEAAKYSDAITKKAKGLAIAENRVFTTLNSIGFDVDESLFTFNAVRATEVVNHDKKYLKTGGTYSVGILFHDEFGNLSFIKSKKTISVPYSDRDIFLPPLEGTLIGPYEGLGGDKSFIQWSLSGKAPQGMTKYQIVLTKNQNQQSTYVQCPALLLRQHINLYNEGSLGAYTEGQVLADTPDSPFGFYLHGKIWLMSYFNVNKYSTSSVRVALMLPRNIPIVPQVGDLIRIHNEDAVSRNASIIEVVGNLITLNLSVYDLFGSFDAFKKVSHLFIDIYKQHENTLDSFFEVGEIHDVLENGDFSVTSGSIYGDTYILNRFSENLNEVSEYFPYFTYVDQSLNYDLWRALLRDLYRTDWSSIPLSMVSNGDTVVVPYFIIESPTPITKETTTLATSEDKRGKSYVLDYTKICSDWGRVFTENENEKEYNLNTVIGYSDPYVQNSKVNGLSTFYANNQYSIPVDRGPITSLVKVGDNILALHERKTSSLYVGQSVMSQGENSFALVKTVDVIGDDREMADSYGTINPESVLVKDGSAYFWDAYRGAVVRYTNAGLFPVSYFGMRQYFIDKSRALINHLDKVRVVTAYDYSRDQFIISFSDVKDESGNVIVPGETWAFNAIDNQWTQRYSFNPEIYASLKTGLLSFKGGSLWEHNINPICNNFYGVQYLRSWKFVCNPDLGKNKKLLNIHHKGEVSNGLDEEFAVVRITTPEGQSTFIPAYEFTKEEGKYVAPVLRDVNTEVEEGQLPLRSGDEIVSDYFEIEVFNNRTDEAPCSHVNAVYKDEEFSI